MPHVIHYVAQLKDSKTGEVVKEQCVHKEKVNAAHDFQDLGLRHCDQLQLIKASQDFMLEFQCDLFTDITHCPTCNSGIGFITKRCNFFNHGTLDTRIMNNFIP